MRVDPPQTAMLLTEDEWETLAVICIRYKDDNPAAPKRHLTLCDRIIEASASDDNRTEGSAG
jgi:hypothetical protein